MTTPYDVLRELADAHSRLLLDIADIRHRMDRQVRHGKVTDVDPAKGLVRIEIGEKDGQAVKSPWLPYAQHVGSQGKWKEHKPPVEGMQMTLFAPNGELRQAICLPFTRSDAATSPGQAGDTNVEEFDKVKIETKGDLRRTTVDDVMIEQKPGEITLKQGSATIVMKDGEITFTASAIKHVKS